MILYFIIRNMYNTLLCTSQNPFFSHWIHYSFVFCTVIQHPKYDDVIEVKKNTMLPQSVTSKLEHHVL